jgi:glycosyltransferase involved in cell wall biosynthesis
MKLSIITINLNNAQGLQRTIESVISQTFTDYEYIIIDGGSTDGSVDIIKQYEDKITYWVSEPDKGIYNAMNKGILQAKGEYLQFLNSGDWLLDGNKLQQVFDERPNEDIVYCDLKTDKEIWSYPDKLSLFSFFKGTIGHPASFIKKILFYNIGFYNEKNKIISDWEFFLIAIVKFECSYKHIALLVTYFDKTGISSDKKYIKNQLNDRQIFFHKNYPLMYDDYLMFYEMSKEIVYYRNSRLIQLIKKIQFSPVYKWVRQIK